MRTLVAPALAHGVGHASRHSNEKEREEPRHVAAPISAAGPQGVNVRPPHEVAPLLFPHRSRPLLTPCLQVSWSATATMSSAFERLLDAQAEEMLASMARIKDRRRAAAQQLSSALSAQAAALPATAQAPAAAAGAAHLVEGVVIGRT